MPKNAFHLDMPKSRTSCVVFASPHSGRDYPLHFLNRSVLDARTLRSSEDAFVDDLFRVAPEFGAPLLTAGAPRAFVDLNRSAEELDPAVIEGVRRGGHNPRVASGLGVVPRVVSNGRAIYRGKLSLAEARHRIDTYWRPYHAELQRLLTEGRRTFGQVVLIDCHSMPHEAVTAPDRPGGKRPDIVLGDRFGASAHSEIVDHIEAAFASAGLTVARNAPFAGAFVTQHYGRPIRGQHAVQVEIDRALYMDEQRVEPSANFDAFKKLLRGVVSDLVTLGQEEARLAAE